jgi:hypothetical protein
VKETASFLLFFPQRSICHVIPKRAFAEEGQIAQVRRIAKAMLGKNAQVRENVVAA